MLQSNGLNYRSNLLIYYYSDSISSFGMFNCLQAFNNNEQAFLGIIFMKQLNRQEIIQRRREKRIITQAVASHKPIFQQCLQRQLMTTDHNSVDTLIKVATHHKIVSTQHKIMALNVIASKTGIHINKRILKQCVFLNYYPKVVEVFSDLRQSASNYFVIKGNLLIYEKCDITAKSSIRTSLKEFSNPYYQGQSTFQTHEQFKKNHLQYTLVEQIAQFRGTGSLFGSNYQGLKRRKLIALEAVIITISQSQYDLDAIIHDGITNEGKMELLNHFPCLKSHGKKIKNFVKFFRVKRFGLNEIIYKRGQNPAAIYFLLKGQVKFEFEVPLSPNQKTSKNRYNHQFVINTQVVGEQGYFGQEQILSDTRRHQTAKSCTSNTITLEFQIQKFKKLMENSDFNELIHQNMESRMKSRALKISKAQQFLINQQQADKVKLNGILKSEVKKLPTQSHNFTQKSRKSFSLHKDQDKKLIWKHGNIIKKPPDNSIHTTAKPKQFSMLHVNPDQYEQTRKKYRKYNLKTVGSSPQKPANLKNIWKTLNLQNIVREQQVSIKSPEGMRIYETSRKYQNHINEIHSTRPKTSSTSHRTKLHYIAYLCQLN